MLAPLVLSLALLAQAPGSPEPTLSLLLTPPEVASIPSHIASFAEAHLHEQLRTQSGVQVLRISELPRQIPLTRRKRLLQCHRAEPACLTALGQAARAEAVLIAELVRFPSGYQIGLRAHSARDGSLLASHVVPGLQDEMLLDTLTQCINKVLPEVRAALYPPLARPEPARPLAQQPEPVQPLAQQPEPVQPLAQQQPGPVQAPPVEATQPVQLAPSGPPGWAWAPFAAGALLGGTAGVYFYGQALTDLDKLRTQAVGRDGLVLRESGRRSEIGSYIAFGAGAASAAFSVALLLSSSSSKPGAVQPAATVVPGGGMVGVAGTLP